MNYNSPFGDDPREKRIAVFEDTMKRCKANCRLAEAVRASIAGTVIYGAQDYTFEIKKGTNQTKLSVTKERTLECAMRLHRENPQMKIAVHNFASATNPGGGVASGSSAQEEALCRCSTLYPCLNTDKNFKNFYCMHRRRNDLRYTDSCIYTPDITVIKTDTDFPKIMAESDWFSVDVLTCAAPNLREKPYNRMNPGQAEPIRLSDGELKEIHIKRAERLLSIAAENGAEALVLGAFGCGAFRNKPLIVAEAYKKVLTEFEGVFKEICFAVYCTQKDTQNFDTFRRIIP
jgi:uncharacterized protein (TIGR02452 family)